MMVLHQLEYKLSNFETVGIKKSRILVKELRNVSTPHISF
jgi:hypothetical protein